MISYWFCFALPFNSWEGILLHCITYLFDQSHTCVKAINSQLPVKLTVFVISSPWQTCSHQNSSAKKICIHTYRCKMNGLVGHTVVKQKWFSYSHVSEFWMSSSLQKEIRWNQAWKISWYKIILYIKKCYVESVNWSTSCLNDYPFGIGS